MIHIANKTYEVVVDHKNGWKPDAFKDRYSEVLERYDYIVGDWGYNQLRLRGFFKENHPKASKESSIATLQDYLNEYCNFGCAYFIIEKVAVRVPGGEQPVGSAEEGTLEADTAQRSDDTVQHLEQPPMAQRHQPQPKPPQEQQQNSRPPRPNNHNRKPHHNNQHRKNNNPQNQAPSNQSQQNQNQPTNQQGQQAKS